MGQYLLIGPVIPPVDLVSGSPDPGPEQLVRADQPEMAEEMGPDLLSPGDERELGGGSPGKPALVLKPGVQVGQQRRQDIQGFGPGHGLEHIGL